MAQFARPANDEAIGAWTGDPTDTTGDRFENIDEVSASDTDFVRAENDPSASVVEFGLATVDDPESSSDHVVRYRYQKGETGGGQPGTINLIVRLLQGTTTIASATHNGISTGFVAGTFTLSGGEADSITDYADLRCEFEVDKSAGARTSWAEVSWFELEVPDAPITQTITPTVVDLDIPLLVPVPVVDRQLAITPQIAGVQIRVRTTDFEPTILLTLTLTPDAVAMPIAFPVPTIKIDQTLTPDEVAMPILAIAASVAMTLVILPDAVAVPVVPTAPTLHLTKTPDALAMPIVTATPVIQVDRDIAPDALAMPIAFPAPTLLSTLAITPDAQAMPIAFPAPTLALTLDLTPAAQTIPLVIPAPTVDVPAGGTTIAPDAQTIPLVLTAPTIHVTKTPDAQAIPLLLPAPSVNQIGTPLQLDPDPAAIPLLLPAPTINVVKTPDPQAIPVLFPAPTVALTLALAPDPQAIPVLFPAPTAALTLALAPDAQAMPLVMAAPTIHVIKTPSALTMPIVLPAPTVDIPSSIVYTSRGGIYLYEAAQWSVGTIFKVEATFRSSTGGDVAVRLFDLTAAAAVANSEIVTDVATHDRYRSGPITLVDGNEYRMQTGVDVAETGQLLAFSLLGLKP
jgi:hypothetical protein